MGGGGSIWPGMEKERGRERKTERHEKSRCLASHLDKASHRAQDRRTGITVQSAPRSGHELKTHVPTSPRSGRNGASQVIKAEDPGSFAPLIGACAADPRPSKSLFLFPERRAARKSSSDLGDANLVSGLLCWLLLWAMLATMSCISLQLCTGSALAMPTALSCIRRKAPAQPCSWHNRAHPGENKKKIEEEMK